VGRDTGRARLGYDRARILFTRYTGWQLHQLRHSAAAHLGEQGIPLQLIMAKTRHRNPRTAMRYVRPGEEAAADITGLLEPHAGEAEQYLPTLRPATASVLSRSS
jgi:integrase